MQVFKPAAGIAQYNTQLPNPFWLVICMCDWLVVCCVLYMLHLLLEGQACDLWRGAFGKGKVDLDVVGG